MQVAFVTLFMASTIGTTFALKLQQIITAMLKGLRITGSYSSLYVLITWTAVTVMLVATLLRIVGGYRSAGAVHMQPEMAASPDSWTRRKPSPFEDSHRRHPRQEGNG